MRRHARLRRGPGLLRARGADGQARGRARHRPDRAATAERARAGRLVADRTEDHRDAARRGRDSPRSCARVPEAEELPRRPDASSRRLGQHDARRRSPARRRLRRRFQEHRLLGGLRRLHAPRESGSQPTAARPCIAPLPRSGRESRASSSRSRARSSASEDVALAPHTTATVGSAGSASASRMTWMASGAVRDACRAALARARAERASGEVDVERIYRHPRTTPLDPGDGADHRRAGARRVRVCGDARCRRGRRRAGPDASRLDRHGAGRRQGGQSPGGDGPDRGRDGPGARAWR